MSNIITTQGRTPAVIAAEIRCHSGQFMRSTFEIGRLLIEAKSMVPTGEWMEYLQTELGFKQSTANNFMRIYKEYNVGGQLPESQTFGILSPTKALALLALPAEEREEFAKNNDVESMSVRQLNAAIKEKDAAVKQARAADAERDAIKKQLSTAQSNEDALKKEIDKLNADLNKAAAAKDKADKEIARLKTAPNIPQDVKKKLIEQAEKDAAAAAEHTVKERLSVMEAQLAEATAAREAAEAALADAQRMSKDAKLSDPDAAAVRILFKRLQEDFNTMHGHLIKVTGRDSETGKSIKKIIRDWLKDSAGNLA